MSLETVAKEAQNDAIDTNFKILYTDIKEHVNIYIYIYQTKMAELLG